MSCDFVYHQLRIVEDIEQSAGIVEADQYTFAIRKESSKGTSRKTTTNLKFLMQLLRGSI